MLNSLEYVTQELGLNPTPFTEIGTNAPIDGINFAIGGAGSGSENVGFGTGFGLEQEIDYFLGFLNGQAANPDALYTLWSGANDYLGLSDYPDKTKEIKETVEVTIDNLSEALVTLASVGAEHILVFNLPDLGKTPLGNSSDPAVQESLTDLVEEHNKILEKELKSLGKEFPNVEFIEIDIYSLFNSFVAEPESYGLINVTEGCTNTDLYDPNSTLDPATLTICDNPETYLFWDSVHPTTTTHELVAQFVLDTLEIEAEASKLVLSSVTTSVLADSTMTDSLSTIVSIESASEVSIVSEANDNILALPVIAETITNVIAELNHADAIAWETGLDESYDSLAPLFNQVLRVN